MSQPFDLRNFRPTFVGLFALALLVRGGMLVARFSSLDADPDAYREIATNLRQRGVFAMSHGGMAQPTAYRPPLYPLALVPCEFFADDRPAIATLHLLLGVGTVLGVWRLGLAWGLSNRAAALAAMLIIFDPLLLNLSVRVFSESLAAFLVVVTLLTLTPSTHNATVSRAAASGCLMGLCVLTRPTFLVWLVLVAAALLWQLRRQKPLARVGVFLASALIVVAPWVVRNEWVFSRPIVTTTHGGYTLLLANNPNIYAYLREAALGEVWDPSEFFTQWKPRRVLVETPEGAVLDELASDVKAYTAARQAIADDPTGFARACAVRLGWLWGVLPHQTGPESAWGRVARWGVAAWYGAELLLAACGAWSLGRRLWSSPWFWGVLLLASFTTVHALFWTNLRMRAPLESVVALLAAGGAALLVDRGRTASPWVESG